MKKYFLLLLILNTLLLTGCWDQKLVERTGVILYYGVETSPDGGIKVTSSIPIIEKKDEKQVEILSSNANLFREGRENLRKMSPKILDGGKIQEVFFSKELAQKGIQNWLEVLERVPNNPVLSYVAIVDGSTNELITKAKSFDDKPRPAFYLKQLLDNGVQYSYLPNTKVYSFDINYFSGIDPIAPLVKLESKDVIMLGSAIFSKDKMVGQISTTQTSILLAMMNKFDQAQYAFNTQEIEYPNKNSGKSGIEIRLTDLKRQIKIDIQDNKPNVNITLKFSGILDEFKWNAIEEQQEIEKILSKELTDECNNLINYIQSINSDPIGIGEMYRAKYNNYWNSIKWDDMYKVAKINVTAKLGIKHYGVIR